MRGALSVAILPWNITISFLDPRVERTGWRILSPCAMSTTNFVPMG